MERNSEGKKTWVVVALGVAEIVFAALDQILSWGVIPQDHVAATIITGVLAVAGSVGIYTAGRSKKKAAEAGAEAVAKSLAARQGNS